MKNSFETMNPSERFLILAAHWEPLKEFFYIPRPRPDGGLWVSAFKKKKSSKTLLMCHQGGEPLISTLSAHARLGPGELT